jgi:hypothetical protein
MFDRSSESREGNLSASLPSAIENRMRHIDADFQLELRLFCSTDRQLHPVCKLSMRARKPAHQTKQDKSAKVP